MPEPEIELHVKAGPHDRTDCPVVFDCPALESAPAASLISNQGARLTVQRIKDGTYAAVLPWLRAHEVATYRLTVKAANPSAAHAENAQDGVELHSLTEAAHPGAIEVRIGGQMVTRYVCEDVKARPYFFPLIGPNGARLTRSYPMETVEGEMHDHPHHRSLWIAHGDVNGTDNWSEESGHGFTRHCDLDHLVSGTVFGKFRTRSEWESAAHAPLLTQQLQVTAWKTSAAVRLIDFDIDLHADRSDVVFGDTKEGGILSVRVASSMDVPRGGRITNSYGGVDEGETWGRSAHWCDYAGLADGQPGGIAVLNHPLSFRHPTTWHVRNYGLMTANPFGYAAFTNGVQNGEYTLRLGDTLRFRYRVVLHSGDVHQGAIAGHYLNYACPPTVTVSGAQGR
jgi:hypothetical protein